MHNAQALLATTPFGVGGRAHETPGSPQTGNLGLFYRTPLVFPTRRPAEELAKLQAQEFSPGFTLVSANGPKLDSPVPLSRPRPL